MKAAGLNESVTVAEGATKRPGPLGKRILLAEDEQSVRQTVALVLGMDEHMVVQATNGAEALALFKEGRFDLVITDLEMPRMKGDELATRIKASSPAQPILVMTAYAERLGSCSKPFDARLEKPFALEDLRRAVAELTD